MDRLPLKASERQLCRGFQATRSARGGAPVCILDTFTRSGRPVAAVACICDTDNDDVKRLRMVSETPFEALRDVRFEYIVRVQGEGTCRTSSTTR